MLVSPDPALSDQQHIASEIKRIIKYLLDVSILKTISYLYRGLDFGFGVFILSKTCKCINISKNTSSDLD